MLIESCIILTMNKQLTEMLRCKLCEDRYPIHCGGLTEASHKCLTCLDISNHVIHDEGGVVCVVHDEGGVGHLVIWPNGLEVVEEGSIHVIHKAEALGSGWYGGTPCPYIWVVSEGGWGAPERFLTRKNVLNCVIHDAGGVGHAEHIWA